MKVDRSEHGPHRDRARRSRGPRQLVHGLATLVHTSRDPHELLEVENHQLVLRAPHYVHRQERTDPLECPCRDLAGHSNPIEHLAFGRAPGGAVMSAYAGQTNPVGAIRTRCSDM
jgi:hypothetical protein